MKDVWKKDLIFYLESQPGVLRSMMRGNESLAARLVAFFSGNKPILIIGGESGMGKSLLVGELFIRHHDCTDKGSLFRPKPSLPPIAVITYDVVHHMFIEALNERVCRNVSMPRGETWPKARRLVVRVMLGVVSYAMSSSGNLRLVLVEAPLFNARGELLAGALKREGFGTQILLLHGPEMWRRVLQEAKRLSERSGQRPAMLEMRRWLLKAKRELQTTIVEQDNAVLCYWQTWLSETGLDGMVVSWDPRDDEGGIASITQALQNRSIIPDHLYPKDLVGCARREIQSRLDRISDLEAFAEKFQAYRSRS